MMETIPAQSIAADATPLFDTSDTPMTATQLELWRRSEWQKYDADSWSRIVQLPHVQRNRATRALKNAIAVTGLGTRYAGAYCKSRNAPRWASDHFWGIFHALRSNVADTKILSLKSSPAISITNGEKAA